MKWRQSILYCVAQTKRHDRKKEEKKKNDEKSQAHGTHNLRMRSEFILRFGECETTTTATISLHNEQRIIMVNEATSHDSGSRTRFRRSRKTLFYFKKCFCLRSFIRLFVHSPLFVSVARTHTQ